MEEWVSWKLEKGKENQSGYLEHHCWKVEEIQKRDSEEGEIENTFSERERWENIENLSACEGGFLYLGFFIGFFISNAIMDNSFTKLFSKINYFVKYLS
jgi:hypothetical protein